MARERFVEPPCVEDVGQEWRRPRPVDRQHHLVKAVLVAVEHRQRCAAEGRHVATELGADRAAGTCNEDAPPFDERAHDRRIRAIGARRQQLFDVGRSHPATSTCASSSATAAQMYSMSSAARLAWNGNASSDVPAASVCGNMPSWKPKRSR